MLGEEIKTSSLASKHGAALQKGSERNHPLGDLRQGPQQRPQNVLGVAASLPPSFFFFCSFPYDFILFHPLQEPIHKFFPPEEPESLPQLCRERWARPAEGNWLAEGWKSSLRSRRAAASCSPARPRSQERPNQPAPPSSRARGCSRAGRTRRNSSRVLFFPPSFSQTDANFPEFLRSRLQSGCLARYDGAKNGREAEKTFCSRRSD